MSTKPQEFWNFIERLTLFTLTFSFLLGLGFVQFRRQQPSFSLQVVSENPPFPVSLPTISLNSATAEELTRLPGVGPKLAGRIVSARSRQGRFATLEDLLKVKGIGPKLYERLIPCLRLE